MKSTRAKRKDKYGYADLALSPKQLEEVARKLRRFAKSHPSMAVQLVGNWPKEKGGE